MEELHIEGMRPLKGELTLHGAKNSVLPLLAASLLTQTPTTLDNCPPLSDVAVSTSILQKLGCRTERDADSITVYPTSGRSTTIPERLMREMRSSIVFLGAMLARFSEAHLCFPGGCELGPRPIDLHLSSLRQMGVTVREDGGVLHCYAPRGLHGASVSLSFPSVGATQNCLLAAVLAKGKTVICNAAKEPEIEELCRFLNACGANIERSADGVITVTGVSSLEGCRYRVMPDRIEAVTYLAATAITGGELLLNDARPSHIAAVLSTFRETGCRVAFPNGGVYMKAPVRLKAAGLIRTMPYPGFPTDAQAPVMAMLTKAVGNSMIVENIFDSRFKHVGELQRMGASVKTDGRVAVIDGVARLRGATVRCTDLRGGAALVVAALGAEGQTRIQRLCHLDRGYAALETSLRSIGGCVTRVKISQ